MPKPVTLQAVMRFLAIFLNIVDVCLCTGLVICATCLYVQINFNLFANEMKFVCSQIGFGGLM